MEELTNKKMGAEECERKKSIGEKILDILLFLPRAINRSLRVKITYKTTILYAILYSVVFAVIAFFCAISISNSVKSAATNKIIEKIDFLASVVRIEGIEGIDEGLAEYLGGDLLVRKNGIIVYSEGDIKLAYFDKDITHSSQLVGEDMTVLKRYTINGDEYSIFLKQNIKTDLEHFYLLRTLFFSLIPIGLVIVVALGSLTSASMLKPIKQINSTIAKITAESLETRIKSVDSQDELNELVGYLNKMLDELENSFLEQARFVSDASHELRTPISVIQGYANLLERWGKTDPKMLDEAIAAISKESDNMKNLVDKLLFLARTQTLTVKKEQFVLSELIEEIAKETQMTSKNKIDRVEITRLEPVEVVADRALIKQAIRIFVDNAVKYSGEHGVIKLYCYAKEENAVLRIGDNGMGIPEGDIPYIFERFFRCDAARNRNSGSTGLGLSIAKWIIDNHGGVIDVTSEEGIGTDFYVRLDRAGQEED